MIITSDYVLFSFRADSCGFCLKKFYFKKRLFATAFCSCDMYNNKDHNAARPQKNIMSRAHFSDYFSTNQLPQSAFCD